MKHEFIFHFAQKEWRVYAENVKSAQNIFLQLVERSPMHGSLDGNVKLLRIDGKEV